MFEPVANQRATRNIVDNMARVRLENEHNTLSPKAVVFSAIAQDYPELSRQDVENVSREIALADKSKEIKVGNKTIYESLPALADSIERISLSVSVADSLERSNNETSASEEYFRWIDEGSLVIAQLNDGLVEQFELDNRDALLSTMKQREVEIMVCLNLYKSSDSNYAKTQYAELSKKLFKLREIRSAVHANTDGKVLSENTTAEKHKRAAAYIAAMQLIKQAEKGTENEKKAWNNLNKGLGMESSLNVAKQNTQVLDTGRSPEIDADIERLKQVIAYELLKGKHDSYAESIVMSRRSDYSKEDLAKSINRLRGIKTEAEKQQELEERISKIRQRRIVFDMEKRNMLSQQQDMNEGYTFESI